MTYLCTAYGVDFPGGPEAIHVIAQVDADTQSAAQLAFVQRIRGMGVSKPTRVDCIPRPLSVRA